MGGLQHTVYCGGNVFTSSSVRPFSFELKVKIPWWRPRLKEKVQRWLDECADIVWEEVKKNGSV